MSTPKPPEPEFAFTDLIERGRQLVNRLMPDLKMFSDDRDILVGLVTATELCGRLLTARNARQLRPSDREWLQEIMEACSKPPQEAPHIGPPLLTRLVEMLLAQDKEINRLETDLEEAVHLLKVILQDDVRPELRDARVFVGLMERERLQK